ncbi:hypothetical protein JCM10207_004165 [Rhodosporidiobolus poonsookiae]
MGYPWKLVGTHIDNLAEVLREQGEPALARDTSKLLKKHLKAWYIMATDEGKSAIFNALYFVRKEIKEYQWTPHSADDVWERVKTAAYRAIGRRAALHYGTTKEDWEAGRAW